MASPSNVDVTWEDQKKICLFGRLNQRMRELQRVIQTAKESIEAINDAADEIYIADDVKFVVGECFFTLPSVSSAEARLTECKLTPEKQLETSQREVALIETRMSMLKAELKVKFGESIHLDND
ncbi:hypothetical protein XU18_0386 [Perkinsela sp. CCAP 1560/4]|nr:hypothetical protein XU18_0386 [Perkinsela sp. CCAP 1560/4]|eukprot:KNH09701.1 hypothetical protein XU18_0386 [Perkinsela sp. CCAP 1560/4]